MRRLSLVLSLLATLALAGSAWASGSGGAAVPKQAANVLDGGGAVFAPPTHTPQRRKRGGRKPVEQAPAVKRRLPRRTVRRPVASGHHFPVAGPFHFGGAGSRFGAGRDGHTHQGQDLAAAEGTPVVAPFAGVTGAVQYQASGAGHYVVLRGDGEDRDYVFMHLQTGSVPVGAGTRVRGGQLVGRVGNTGRSFGAHLHFEIWVGGGWFSGGRPIDPLPLLRFWAPR